VHDVLLLLMGHPGVGEGMTMPQIFHE